MELKGNIAKTKEKKIEFLFENLKNIFAEPIKSENIFFEEFVNKFYDKLQEEPVLNNESLSNNISDSEISEMIKNAKNKKAPGLDNVTIFINSESFDHFSALNKSFRTASSSTSMSINHHYRSRRIMKPNNSI